MSLKSTVFNSILPLVQKPGRYTGNEIGAIHKDHTGRIKFCLCFPDLYEIGMSNLGVQIIYHRINCRDDALCERAFCAETDFEEKLIRFGLPLYSLESFTPLKQFDFVGFSIGYEITFGGVLDILNLAGIPLLSKDRRENEPIIIAGGPAILNPEPLSDFIDIFYLGDGEEVVDEIIDIAKSVEFKQGSRENKLKLLSGISGCYVPSFYEIDSTNGQLKPRYDDIPGNIKIRSVKRLKNEFYPTLPVVPNIETVHDRLTIEIMRGCPRGCRFCQAGYQYRPKRERARDDIIRQVDECLLKTGYDEVSLQSLSTTDYSELEELLTQLNQNLRINHHSLALPSFRPGTLSLDILNSLDSGRKTGLTFAPEAGTQRLRNAINKDITEDEILSTSDMAFSSGWNNIKLYFMIGLPTETEEDVRSIVELIRKIESIARRYKGRKKISVTISPMVPKPFTPFQWERQMPLDAVLSRFRILRSGLRSKIIELKFHHAESSIIEGIICRSGRDLGKVLLEIHKSGLRLQAWSEHFEYNRWIQAMDECGFDYHRILEGFNESDVLPWSHIDKGIPFRFFVDEKNRAYKNEPLRKKKNAQPVKIEQKDDKPNLNMAFGRHKYIRKKASTIQLPKSTVRIRWARDERMRFLSHRDMMRVFQRAIRRSNIPIKYSQGFSPHQRMSFGPPLPVGYTSDDEYIDIYLSEPFDYSMLNRIQGSLPEGINLHDAVARAGFMKSLTGLINLHEYTIIPNVPVNRNIINRLPEEIRITRIKDDQERQFDIRPGLYQVDIKNETQVLLTIHSNRAGVGRPEEYLQHLLGMDEITARISSVHRARQYILKDDKKYSVFEIST